ncbi:iron-containing alcohol dehydrogenase [Acetivibrio mesophilus]|uniref:Iron-containing alcohol dehydrogenase n=1 Tax=Acetivibrio mesophilus TaxID=2487273 RepID=A0A4V1K258_9FIRM|nr:iron-containing alcohol dehydrogenase [Acetivibrio mesophilus]ODM26063.1 butanol dehydrogenase [Clostridium sp. Bc-iso-3]RXE59139.1 iron-containing alcohol dehydrogenase [Acetivibrio mesophilus]HHV28269.1 iron-containing alcohol dehydrogenase [Clostridium sp.]
MVNFTYKNTTKIIFGKGTELKVGEEVKRYSTKVLLHYGGGSIKKTGLYDKVINSLKQAGIEVVELGGVMPNPRLSLVNEGIRVCREKGIDFVLAVGGGSAIDSAKAIAVGVPYNGDVWDFFCGKAYPKEALPIGVILTIPAAGSEASPNSVITNEDGLYKRGMYSELIMPVFSIMNPELTYTLPEYQTACGTADIMAHIMERYFTNITHADLTDRLCEATLKTMIKNVPIVLDEPENYNARAEVMWAGTVAHNGLLGTGRIEDWASHNIEHEISAIYDVAHGAGLAVVFPAWMKYVYKNNLNRFVQFAVRVWNVEMNFEEPERTALEGIERLKKFFKQIGLPVSLTEMDISDDRLEEMASKCTNGGKSTIGSFVKLNREDVYNILKLAR